MTACSGGIIAETHDAGSPPMSDDSGVVADSTADSAPPIESGADADAAPPGMMDGPSNSCPNACPGPCGAGTYCQWFGDGMGNGGGGCMSTPAQCLPQPTCACLLAPDAGNLGCTCTESDGAVSVTCC